jgi:hypothetical protein
MCDGGRPANSIAATSVSGVPSPTGTVQTRDGGHRVVVYAEVDDRALLREVLIQAGQVCPADAAIAARLAPGILPPRLTKELAEAVVARIAARGIKASVLPERQVPVLDDAEVLHYVRCPSDGMEVVGLHGEMRRLVRWAHVCLISLGVLRKNRDPRLAPESPVFDREAAAQRQAQADAEPPDGMILWLVCQPSLKIYRLRHDQMNYAYLGQRKTTSATVNFGLLVGDLEKHSTIAYLTPASRAFLHHDLARNFEFESEEALRDYTAFHLLVARRTAGRPPAESGG